MMMMMLKSFFFSKNFARQNVSSASFFFFVFAFCSAQHKITKTRCPFSCQNNNRNNKQQKHLHIATTTKKKKMTTTTRMIESTQATPHTMKIHDDEQNGSSNNNNTSSCCYGCWSLTQHHHHHHHDGIDKTNNNNTASSSTMVSSSSSSVSISCNIDHCGRKGFEEFLNWIVLNGSQSLESLRLQRDGQCRSIHITQLFHILSTNARNIQTLSLHDFNSREEVELIAQYLSSSSSSSSSSSTPLVALRKITITSDHIPTSLLKAFGTLPHLEELHIQSSRWGHVAVDDSIDYLLGSSSSSSTSSLKCLILDAYGTGPRNATNWCLSLSNILQTNKTLQSFEFHFSTGGKPSPFAKQQLLNAIQNYNFSLHTLKIHGWDMYKVHNCSVSQQIQYYLDFNGRGRGKLYPSSKTMTPPTTTPPTTTPTTTMMRMMCPPDDTHQHDDETSTTMTSRMTVNKNHNHQQQQFIQSHEDWVHLLLANSPCPEYHLDWDIHWFYYILQKNPTLCQLY